ncbi:GNAT family N-acetyltransferase [Actinomadura flavalba]|uniref:GNAT family N-acetyltransferase n=1 Tax=Actinomadura flavalba TaxID=1120938 RepID=UPI0012DBEC46|nr:GNAT family N-acetyltransferase [Actinomadura flavalba]
MTDLVIRPATLDDGTALAGLDRRTWSPVSAVLPRPEEGSAFFDAGHSPDDVIVAVLGGAVVGYIRIVPAYRDLASGAHVRAVQGLAVDESARGRGVARALVEAACERAAAEGARRLTLRVLGGNTPARRLYESAGFTVEGVFPGEFLLDGVYTDDVAMGRTLRQDGLSTPGISPGS